MSSVVQAEHRADILASLRRLEGQATVGDVVTDSGLPSDDVRAGLKALLETHRGHLAVTDSGEILYAFEARLIERGREPLLARVRRTATAWLTKAFKAWIVAMLVVYFVVFVVLVLAALFAGNRDGNSRGGWGGRRGGGVRLPVGDFWLWYWIWGPRWRLGRPYYGHRWERTLEKDDRVPFYKKVFAFVFGPDRPEPTRQQLDRSTLRLIRARSGVLTTAELVEHTGLPFDDAEDEMARLLGAYDGEAAVSPDGELVYAFPGLMASAHEARRVRAPNPAWLRLEHPRELTGNTAGANAVVAGMNGFTLLASATAPWFVFPRLGIGGTAAFVGLVLVPLVFSVLFLAVPALRMIGVKRENRRRARRNVRKVLLGLLYRRTLSGGGPISEGEAHAHVTERLREQSVSRAETVDELRALATELDADVEPGEDGAPRYRFPGLRRAYAAGETVRRGLDLGGRSLGEIVYSTADTAVEAAERDMALFDRALDADPPRLDRYAPAADRVAFEDDFEVVAFEEELRARGLIEA